MTNRWTWTALLLAMMVGGAARAAAEGADVTAKLRGELAAATLVVDAEVVGVDPSPGAWSGVLAMYQGVRYRVHRVIKGKLDDKTVRIEHLLVAGSPTADGKEPRLDPRLFHPGARLVVFARPAGKAWRALDEHDAVVPATDELVSALGAAANPHK